MSKSNLELARKIIEQHGDVKLNKGLTAPAEITKDGEIIPSTKKVYSTDLPILAMGFGAAGDTKAEAIDEMAKQLAGELDSGALSLSDTWEKDNLS